MGVLEMVNRPITAKEGPTADTSKLPSTSTDIVKPVEVRDNPKPPDEKKSKSDCNEKSGSATTQSVSADLPVVLHVSEPRKTGEEFSGKTSRSASVNREAMQTATALSDENSESDAGLTSDLKERTSRVQASVSVAERLDNDSESNPVEVASSGPVTIREMEETLRLDAVDGKTLQDETASPETLDENSNYSRLTSAELHKTISRVQVSVSVAEGLRNDSESYPVQVIGCDLTTMEENREADEEHEKDKEKKRTEDGEQEKDKEKRTEDGEQEKDIAYSPEEKLVIDEVI